MQLARIEPSDVGLADRDLESRFRVIRYDRQGHGDTEAPEGPYTIDMLADDAIGLLDHLQLEKVHFCGLSLGGMTGQPWRSQSGAYRTPYSVRYRIVHADGGDVGAADQAGDRVVWTPMPGPTIDRWLTPAFQKSNPEDVAKVREMIVTTPVEGFAGCCAAIRDMWISKTINRITARPW